ncbi:MAG TPA: lytic transglycosylase domain-containing protein [Bdellovibrionota bacterium]|jgi:membrane-bound lytic murein transglycosylase D
MRGARSTAAYLITACLGIVFGVSSVPLFASDTAALLAPEARPVAVSPVRGYGPFPLDPKIESRVRFWVDIYAKYHSYEALIIDIKHPQMIFSVVDTREKPGALPSEKRKLTASLHKLAASLEGIQSGKIKRTSLKPAEFHLLERIEKEGMTAEIPALAADPRRLRTQQGLRDTIEDALFASGKYLPRMEALFERFKLPTEIAYLPFVESGFNKKAVSKVGASGIWQFMPYTGKLYLRVDEVVDERNDPMRAAEAAARLMKQNYILLGDWPMAITAYNHGTSGMAQAARDTGTRSIAEIIEKYDGKTFGFASQNFYACFLAALHVVKNSEAYLGVVPRARKLEFDEFVMPDFMVLRDFLTKMEIDETLFRELNPALTEDVYSGEKYMPVGYTVRVPVESSAGFLHRYEAIPAELKFREQKKPEAVAMPGVIKEEAVPRAPASSAPIASDLPTQRKAE